MNKSDLIARMTERLDGDRRAAMAAVNGVLEEIEGSIARGERVSLTGFGTFERRERPPRTARNPRTGETIQVGASVVPVFRAGTGFRTLLGQDGAASASAAGDGARSGAAGRSDVITSALPASTDGVDADAAAGTEKAGKKARPQAGKKARAEAGGKAAKGAKAKGVKAEKGKGKGQDKGKKAGKDSR